MQINVALGESEIDGHVRMERDACLLRLYRCRMIRFLDEIRRCSIELVMCRVQESPSSFHLF